MIRRLLERKPFLTRGLLLALGVLLMGLGFFLAMLPKGTVSVETDVRVIVDWGEDDLNPGSK